MTAGGLGSITALRTRAITAPLRRPWGPDVPALHLIEVRIETDSGAHGSGFSWTPQIGAHAVQALLDHDIRDFVVGRPAEARELWGPLWAHLHEAGSGGITTIAMAGLDLALWDAAGRHDGRSLTAQLGARHESVEVYGSGVNRHYSLAELIAQAQRWRDGGYRLVKIKVAGRPLAEDVARVAAVRDVLGYGIALAVDANQLWGLDEAERAISELSRFALRWVEEPVRADDLPAAAELRRRVDVPIALGENLHTGYRFRDAIRAGACDILQPNVVRVGGVTPFLEIAELADAASVPLHPHLLPELSGQLALALPHAALVEDVEDASFERLGVLGEPSPVEVTGPRLHSRDRPGLGIAFS